MLKASVLECTVARSTMIVMHSESLGCQEICDPSEGVCFRKADIEHILGILKDSQQYSSIEDKEGALVSATVLLENDCRAISLAKSILDINNID